MTILPRRKRTVYSGNPTFYASTSIYMFIKGERLRHPNAG